MKVGILGGSFNPPHQGHIYLSILAIKKLKLQQLWWVPTLYNNFKDPKIYQSYNQRIADCLNIVKKYQNKIKIIKNPEVKTYLLLKKLKKQYPKYHFNWVMGCDSIIKMDKWHHGREIIKMVDIAVFARDNLFHLAVKSKINIIHKNLSNNSQKLHLIKFYQNRQINISSTAIRAKNNSNNIKKQPK